MGEVASIAVPIAAGLLSWFGSHVALKTHLEYLRRDVDLAHRRIDTIETRK